MPAERLVLSVSQLNNEVGQLLSEGFPALWVEGEVSNLSRPASGHRYFTLKDAQSQLRCALFRTSALKSKLNLENGMKIIARGRVGLYEPRGDYQFIASRVEQAGEGLLQLQFEALKQALAAQGLFDAEHKQPLPEHPRHIGIITSSSGAAVRDILNVLQRRSPQTPVTIYPVAVQGEQAKSAIVAALNQANNDQRPLPCDVLILTRGGGSLEDLWAFNEEMVAQAIYNSTLPVISGIGHEIDYTIADFVADQRAPTPSAAAELVSADKKILTQDLQHYHQQLQTLFYRLLQNEQTRLQNIIGRLNIQHPESKLQQQSQRLDELEMRLRQSIRRYLSQNLERYARLAAALRHQSPGQTVQHYQQHLIRLQSRTRELIGQTLERQQAQLQLQAGRLDAYSPLATLNRGYSLTRDSKQRLVKTVNQIKPGQTLTIQIADGSIECTVEQIQRSTF